MYPVKWGVRLIVSIFTLTLISPQLIHAQSIDPPDFFGDAPDHTMLYVENMDQVFDANNDPVSSIEFYTQSSVPRLYLHSSKISYVLEELAGSEEVDDKLHRVDLTFVSEVGSTGPVGSEQSDVLLNFYRPSTGAGGAEGVRGYQRVTYPAIYPGIDLQFYSSLAGPKAYIIIQPQADPSLIEMNFFGQDNLVLNNQGDLEMLMDQETLVIKQFIAYQVDNSNQITPLTWQPQFVNQGGGNVTLNLGTYDNTKYLVLMAGTPAGTRGTTMQGNGWSTYLGNAGSDYGSDVTVDEDGWSYVTGTTFSSLFPGTGSSVAPYQGNGDAFVCGFNTDRELKWGTYLGGSGHDDGNAIAWTPLNGKRLYVVGETGGAGFPLVQAGGYYETNVQGQVAYITELNPSDGVITYSTYFGGKNTRANDIAVDASGNYFVVGQTTNTVVSTTTCLPPTGLNYPFPVCTNLSPNAYYQDFNASTTGQVLSNQEGFIARFLSNHALTWSSFFGGDNADAINGVAVDDNNDLLYIVGTTNSEAADHTQSPSYCIVPQNGEFPLCDINGPTDYFRVANNWIAQNDQSMTDAFVAKFELNGNDAGKILWNTYFGSGSLPPPNQFTGNDGGTGIAVTSTGDVVITGWTDMDEISGNGFCDIATNNGFPICTTATSEYYQDFGGGTYDSFMARFDGSTSQLTFSSWIGGQGDEYRDLTTEGWPNQGPSVAVNTNDVMFLHGTSYSPSSSGSASFPTQWSASLYQQSYNEDAAQNNYGGSDSYVLGLSSANDLVYASYYGGAGTSLGIGTDGSGEWAGGIATYLDREIFITGGTHSVADFVLGCPVPNVSYCKDNSLNDLANASNSAAYVAQLNESGWIVGHEDLKTQTNGQIQVFPNPTENSLTVTVSHAIALNKPVYVAIFDVSGRKKADFQARSDLSTFTSAEVDVSTFAPGVYIVRISTESDIYSTKFVKR